MDTLNNAHWFIFAASIFASFWVGIGIANVEWEIPNTGYPTIIGVLANLALIIVMVYNLVQIIRPLL